MADDLHPGDMRDIWRDQNLEVIKMSSGDLRRKAEQLEAKNRRAFRGIVLFMVFAAAGYIWLLYAFAGVIQRVGATLTLAGYCYCFYELYRIGAVRRSGAVRAAQTCSTYRLQLEFKRELCATAWRRFMLPLVAGPATFVMGFLVPEQGIVKAVVFTTLLIASPFALAIPLLRREAARVGREIASLDSLTE